MADVRLGVKLGAIICHQETNGRGSDEVAALFVFEPVERPSRAEEAFVVDADVDSDEGSQHLDLEQIEATAATSFNPVLMFQDLFEGDLKVRMAGLEIDGVGSTASLARTQMDDFKEGPLGDTRHDRLWATEFTVSPAAIEQFVIEGTELPDFGYTSNPLSMTNRWDKVDDTTVHQHLVFTSTAEESEYEVILAYLLDEYRPPEEEPTPFLPLPFPFPFPFRWTPQS